MPGPEEVLRQLGSAIDEGNVLRFELFVDIDSVAVSVGAAINRLATDRIRQAIRVGMDEGKLAASTVGALFEAGGVEYAPALDEASNEMLFRGLGEVIREGDRAIATLLIGHPFDPLKAIDLGIELTRSEEGWRVVGMRRIAQLLESAMQGPQDSRVEGIRRDLRNLMSQQEIYYSDAYRYTDSLDLLGFRATGAGVVEVLGADENTWSATASIEGDPPMKCAAYNSSRGLPPIIPITNLGFIPRESLTVVCDDDPVSHPYWYLW